MPLSINFSRFVGSKAILLLLSSVIVVHLGLMFYSLQNNRSIRQKAQREAVTQKIINTVYLLGAMPAKARAKAVSAIADPMLMVTMTRNPEFKFRFYNISFWEINRGLRNRINDFRLSLRLQQDQWLNISAKVYAHLFSEQLIFIAVEIFIFSTLLISAWSINRFTRPLQNFKRVAERLGIDLDTKPLDVYGPSIVREASEAMNKMQQRIVDLIRDRTQMLAAISHDLRTPITRMKLRTQFLEDASLSESYAKDLDEMEQMINETLSFAREDCNKEKATTFDIVSLIQTVCDDAEDMGHEVVFSSKCHRVALSGRPLSIKRALINLINNAIRYGGKVAVSLIQRQKHLYVQIDDEGPGIPEEDFERVFAPYYRREQSRSRHTGGVGLGLAVTRDIIKAHNGNITLKNRKPHGLRVILDLPIA